MKKSEALAKINQFNESLDESLSPQERVSKLLDFIEHEKIMLPSPEYQSKEGIAYGCEWEPEDKPEADITAI